MPRRTTPLVRIQKRVPGVACCTWPSGDIFEKLKGQVEKDCRFRIVVSRLEIGGILRGVFEVE